MKHCIIHLLMLLLPCVSAFCAGQEWPQEKISEVLNRLEQIEDRKKPRKVQFREEKISPMFRDPVVSTGVLWFAPPNQFRREVAPPNPSTIISNGKTLWLIYPEFKEVEEYSLDGKFPFAQEMEFILSGLSLRNLTKNFRLRTWGERDRIERMELRPRGARRLGVQQILITMNSEERPQRLEILSQGEERSVWEILSESSFVPTPDFFLPSIPSDWKVYRPLESR